jgi:hypothetical protein
MLYRNWKIRVYPSFLGYFVQYVSPSGQAYQTSACFHTDAQAISYAQTRVDYLLDCERLRFAAIPVPPGLTT